MDLTSEDGNLGSLMNRLSSDEAAGHHSPEIDDRKLKTPYVGMQFETLEEAGKYYEDYGRQEGFWIRIRSSSKSRSHSKEVTGRSFVCAHQGKHAMQNPKEDVLKEKDEIDENDEGETCDLQIEKKRHRSCSTVKCGCEAKNMLGSDRVLDEEDLDEEALDSDHEE